jgi:transcription initiation factor TFIIIB Brf1 subunit/transcription initiation factor TFIIB
MASVRCPECEHKQKVPSDYERATIRCSECGFKIPLDDDDDDDIDERPIKKKKKRRTNNVFTGALGWLARLDVSIKIAVGIWIGVLLLSCFHPKLMFGPLGYGIILVILANILFLIVVFNDSPFELLLVLVLPFYNLYYLVTHWEETKATFFMHIFGIVVIASTLCALPVHLAFSKIRESIVGNVGPDGPQANKDRADDRKPGDDNPPNKDGPIVRPPPPKITGDPAMDEILEDFQGKDDKARENAMKTLMAMKPNQHRAAVVKRLNDLARVGDDSTKHRFLQIMKTWATRDDTAILIPYLNDPHPYTRSITLVALGETGDPRAVDAVVRNLVTLKDEWHATDAQRKNGPPAELHVLKLLNDPQPKLRGIALNLLKDVGTPRSIPALQALATNGPVEVRGQAEGTIKIIQSKYKK